MNTKITTGAIGNKDSIVFVTHSFKNDKRLNLNDKEIAYIKSEIKDEKNLVAINHYDRWIFISVIDIEKKHYITNEKARKAGDKVGSLASHKKLGKVVIIGDSETSSDVLLSYMEGMALGNYQFLKYRKDAKKETNSLKEIVVDDKRIKAKDLEHLEIIVDATCKARDLVNEPLNALNATGLANAFKQMGKDSGFKIEVLDKEKIKALKMGGLLAVNLGSIDPPTFSIMEWKPAKAVNKHPIVLVGKGVVYDTGGMSLKTTLNSMDFMKCDMGGAAAVGCAMYAIAKAKLPVHVIALVPATDNRVDGNAYVPGDVITMHSGLTVEVLNTDAEGRMILADALSYAQKYKPQLVIDIATLTGAAAAAIGHYGTVCMGTTDDKTMNKLKESGNNVYERLVEFPMWDEYGELIKSDIAEIKNVGGPAAGSITAGKFLEHFTDYPYIHLDIAGSAFVKSPDSYRGKNGTGVGVRLLFDYIKSLS
jgi:leucyl aminopeptidase